MHLKLEEVALGVSVTIYNATTVRLPVWIETKNIMAYLLL